MAFPPTYQIFNKSVLTAKEWRNVETHSGVHCSLEHTQVRVYENLKILFLLGYSVIL